MATLTDRFQAAWDVFQDKTGSQPLPERTPGEREADLHSEVRAKISPLVESYAELHHKGRVDLITPEEKEVFVQRAVDKLGLFEQTAESVVAGITHEARIRQLIEDGRRLEKAVGLNHMWEFENTRDMGDLRTYQHSRTENEIHLDRAGRFYEVAPDRASTVISREDVRRQYQEVPATLKETEDHRRTWEPLEKAIGYKGADQFESVGRYGDIQAYGAERYEQRVVIGVDSKGRFYDMDSPETPQRVSRDDALIRAGQPVHFYTPEEQAPGHKEWHRFEVAVGLERARDYTWAEGSHGVHSYRHDFSGVTLTLDRSGRVHNQSGEEIQFPVAELHTWHGSRPAQTQAEVPPIRNAQPTELEVAASAQEHAVSL